MDIGYEFEIDRLSAGQSKLCRHAFYLCPRLTSFIKAQKAVQSSRARAESVRKPSRVACTLRSSWKTLPEFLHSPYWMMFQLFRRIQCHHTTDPFRGAWKAVLRSTLSVPQALGIPMPLTRGMYAIVLLSGLTSRATTEKPRMCGTRCANIATLQCFNAHGLGLKY